MSVSSRDSFEYLDEKSTAPDLICSVCQEVCTNPQCTPCDHLFCHACISRLIGRLYAPCPNCRTRLFTASLKPANSLLVQMINQLAVRCVKCGRQDLKREQIDHHIRSECPETIVRCHSLGNLCPWRGQVSQLNNHLQHCLVNQLTPMIHSVRDENRSLRTLLTDAETTYARNERSLSSALRNCEEGSGTLADLSMNLKSIEMNRKECQQETNKAREELRTCEERVKKMKMDSLQYQLSTKYLKERFKKARICTDDLSGQEQLLENLLFSGRCAALNEYLMQQSLKTSIDLSGRHLVDPDIAIIAQHIVQDQQCQHLDLHQNAITEQGISVLASVWQTYSRLETVSLAFNAIGDRGVQHLIPILLLESCHLTKLDLDATGMTDAGATALAQALRTNRTLLYVSLGKNQINDTGMESLAVAIKEQHHNLKELHLHDNRLNETSSVYSFVATIQTHPSLAILNLAGCHISPMNQFRLKQTVKHKANFSLLL